MSTIAGATDLMLAWAADLVRDDLARVEAIFDAEIASDQPEVASLCEHLGRFRGKMLRPAVLLLAARATGEVKPIHHGFAAVIEMFHLATLVHDDVLDEARARRKATTVNAAWGNESAVMLGDWLISHAYHLCSKCQGSLGSQGSQWVSLEIASVGHRVCQGELTQLCRRGELAISTEDYLRIIAAKTGALIGLSARLGAHLNDAPAGVEQACLDYGMALGIAFQIADDVLDIVGDEREVGKTLRSDLAEGKATLPLIHFLQSADALHVGRIRKLLNGHPGTRAAIRAGRPVRLRPQPQPIPPAGVRQARRMIIDAGCIGSAMADARRYAESAKACLSALPPGPPRTALEQLADFAATRSR